MAINDMIMPGVRNPLLAVAEEIRKQISQTAMTPPQKQTSPPTAGMPEDRDYAEGMQRPDLTKLKAEREFKATPSRTSAFLVALGNILQDKQNLEAAKQQTAQNEYNAKLADAMEMNKLFKTGKMKREFDESDPDTQLRREMLQLDLAQKKEMYPLEKQYKQTALDRLLAKGTGGGGRASGGGEVISEMPSGFAAIIAQNSSTFDPVTREPQPTPQQLELSYRQYLSTNPNAKDRVTATGIYNSFKSETPKSEKKINLSPAQETYQFYRDQGDPPPLALEKTKQHGFKPEKSLDRLEEESVARERGAIRAYTEPITPSPAPTVPTPSSKVEEYKKRRGLK